MLKFPGDDARLDLTDLFLFASPDSADRTVLIFNVNPFVTAADFHPEAVYRLNIDNDGDAQADAAFSFVFGESVGGAHTGTVYYATGSHAREPEPVGEVLIEGMPAGKNRLAACTNLGNTARSTSSTAKAKAHDRRTTDTTGADRSWSGARHGAT